MLKPVMFFFGTPVAARSTLVVETSQRAVVHTAPPRAYQPRGRTWSQTCLLMVVTKRPRRNWVEQGEIQGCRLD